MGIIDRYIGRQILVATVFGVLVLTLVFGLGHIFKEVLPRLVEGALPLDMFLRSIVYIVPFSLAYTMPWGFLTAVLLVFGRLSADSELVALRMTGLSMWRICRPVFVLAVFFTGICFWLNVSVSPQAKGSIKKLLFNIARSDPASVFKAGEVVDRFPGRLIYVGEKEGALLRDVQIIELIDVKSAIPARFIFAAEMEIKTNLDEEQILLPMKDIQMEVKDDGEPRNGMKVMHGLRFESFTPDLSLREVREKRLKPSEMTVGELRDRVADPDTPEDDRAEMRSEAPRRWALSFASFTFCFVGIPLGVTAHRRETSIGFVFSLAVAVLYFLFIIMADIFRDQEGILPYVLMWSPNVIFTALGAWLFYRVNRC